MTLVLAPRAVFFFLLLLLMPLCYEQQESQGDVIVSRCFQVPDGVVLQRI